MFYCADAGFASFFKEVIGEYGDASVKNEADGGKEENLRRGHVLKEQDTDCEQEKTDHTADCEYQGGFLPDCAQVILLFGILSHNISLNLYL